MTELMLKPGKYFDFEINGLTQTGEGVGQISNFVIFVPGGIPGDLLRVKLAETHKNYGRAVICEIIKPSPDRINPFCKAFGSCGGCDWQAMKYEAQLKWKQKIITETLSRVGKIENPNVLPVIPAPSQFQTRYRNKVQHPVAKTKTNGLIAGFYGRQSHHIVDIDNCGLELEQAEQAVHSTLSILNQSDFPAYDEKTGKGLIKHIVVRTSQTKTETLLIIVVKENFGLAKSIASKIMDADPRIAGVLLNINPERTNVVLGNKFILLAGRNHIFETINNINFRISAPSFFQVNTSQAVNLCNTIMEMSELTGKETVLDLYCGIGLLGLNLADKAKLVIGIDETGSAIGDGRFNAVANKLSNAKFVNGKVEDILKTQKLAEKYDVAIIDPPRQGCKPEVLKFLEKKRPNTIIYVSCYPATMSRDIQILSQYGFNLEAVQPLDMFPQTGHVESVAKLCS